VSHSDVLGAPASSAGDDFHELWALRRLLELLDPASDLTAVKMEGVPEDERTAELGPGALAVDVTQVRGDGESESFLFEQLKYSTAAPHQAWTWARLTREARRGRKGSSVLGKLAAAFRDTSGRRQVRIVTNQPLAAGVAQDLPRFVTELRGGPPSGSADLARLRTASGLDDGVLANFLEAFELDGFASASRLVLEAEALREISRATDADARDDLDVLQQRVAALVLPENRSHAPIDRTVLLNWMGAGATVQMFPAPSEIVAPNPMVRRKVTSTVVRKILATPDKVVRVHAGAGCGKTSLVATLTPALPPGSEVFVYDCYGGGLFLAADQRRHLPAHALVQMANEIAGRLSSPFVMRRSDSLELASAFQRRLVAAAQLLEKDGALLVVVFDAVDNARIGADHWRELCFLDEVLALSGWPENVRLVVTTRTGRRAALGHQDRFEDVEVPAFDVEETAELLRQARPEWDAAVAAELWDLSDGIPRRLAYALEGAADVADARARLMPKQPNLDPLFETRVREAGAKLGDAGAVWRLLCALAHLPRPAPAWALAQVCGLADTDVADLANDVGGIMARLGGWSFADEDFEAFTRDRTAALAAEILDAAADLLFARRHEAPYAAHSLAEILVQAGRTQTLYKLVMAAEPPEAVRDVAERRAILARRVAMALRCARHAHSAGDANRILVAAADGLKTDRLLRELIFKHIDLAVLFSREEAVRLVLGERAGRKYRARLRLGLASAEADADPPTARDHLRWWVAGLQQNWTAAVKDRMNVSVEDIALEAETVWRLHDVETALGWLVRWRKRKTVLDAARMVARRLARQGRAEDVVRVLELRSWPDEVVVMAIATLLRAGACVAPLWLGRALVATGRLRRRDPARRPEEAARVLELVEAALTTTELRELARAILERHFPPDAARGTDHLKPLFDAADLTARALALRERLGETLELAATLPPPRPLPAYPPAPTGHARRPREKDPEAEARRRAQSWNEERERLLSALGKFLHAARLRLDADTTPQSVTGAMDQMLHAWARGGGYRRELQVAGSAARRLAQTWAHDLARRNALDSEALRRLRTDDEPAQVLTQLEPLADIPDAGAQLAEPLADAADRFEQAPGTASERAGALMRCARLALTFDHHLAENFYRRALSLTERLDTEAVSQLHAAAAVATRGTAGDEPDRRNLAERLADAAGAVFATLGEDGEMHVPFAEVLQGCVGLHPPTAFAALGRWHDLGVFQLDQGLEALLDSAPSSLPPMLRRLVGLLKGAELPTLTEVSDTEVLAWQALTSGDAARALYALRRLDAERPPVAAGGWAAQLQTAQPQLEAFFPPDEGGDDDGARPAPEVVAVASLDTAAAIDAALDALKDDQHVGAYRLRGVTDRVQVRPLWRATLEKIVGRYPRHHGCADLLAELVPEWSTYPSVRDWAKTELPIYISAAVPQLFQWRYDDTELLENLLTATGLDDAGCVEILLAGVEANAENLSPDLLLAILGVIGKHSPPDARRPILEQLLANIGAGVDRAASPRIVGATAPGDPAQMAAGLLFALMGDIDKRVRWQATHTARRLCGDPDLIAALASRLDSNDGGAFGALEAPFYRTAARQQLAATLHGIAIAAPAVLAPHAPLLARAAIAGEPHVVTREFLKRTVLELVAHGAALDAATLLQVNGLNASPFPPLPAKRGEHRYGRQDLRAEAGKPLRYDFDDTDTIPYWYSPAANVFGLPVLEVARRAERWICDEWRVAGQPWRWSSEPRPRRYGHATDGLTSHRHGAEPIVERLSRYLEWHALQCVMGELICETPVIDHGYGDEWQDWIDGHFLTLKTLWLADLRTAPPLEARFWHMEDAPLPDAANWLSELPDYDFAQDLSDPAGADRLVVQGSFSFAWEDLRQHVTISSALVTPATALALGRALQTARDPMDFLLPPAGDDSQILKEGFRLEGWLQESTDEPRFDKADPYRGVVSKMPVYPSEHLARTLGLKWDPTATGWRRTSAGPLELGIAYWGAEEDGDVSNGWRATATRGLLIDMLQGLDRSLIVEVKVTRARGPVGDAERRTRWRMFVFDAGGTITAVTPERKGLGCYLVRKLRLDPGVDTFGRWLAHRAEELVRAAAAVEPGAQREAAEAELAAVFRRLRTRPRQRW